MKTFYSSLLAIGCISLCPEIVDGDSFLDINDPPKKGEFLSNKLTDLVRVSVLEPGETVDHLRMSGNTESFEVLGNNEEFMFRWSDENIVIEAENRGEFGSAVEITGGTHQKKLRLNESLFSVVKIEKNKYFLFFGLIHMDQITSKIFFLENGSDKIILREVLKSSSRMFFPLSVSEDRDTSARGLRIAAQGFDVLWIVFDLNDSGLVELIGEKEIKFRSEEYSELRFLSDFNRAVNP